jgi:archaellum component FlaC
MKFKDKVISNLDSVSNQLHSLKNMVENNNINAELLMRELEKLSNRVEEVSDMVSLEDNDFAVLRQGINS